MQTELQHSRPSSTPIHPLDQLEEALQRLKEEHDQLLDQLGTLYDEVKGISQEQNMLSRQTRLYVLRDEALEFQRRMEEHAAWEDTVMFPLIGNYFGEQSNHLTVMEQEHEIAEQFVLAFIEAVKRAPVREHEAKEMGSYLQEALMMLERHFLSEEQFVTELWDLCSAYGY
ncbi:hemerythrin domain-containing protein [Paenibacillus sambharensis]|uniref:hemerythrin domain-containing protein n=1 Tax=Paenibacillus sambharensis TaxID=1803190 RepID=UPI0015E87FBC|nr:hemerythrin domain-containing protein [Paenibacillus sambharensis]